jgi:cytochrome c oxidase subunit III
MKCATPRRRKSPNEFFELSVTTQPLNLRTDAARRQRTGRIGVLFFIASETMFFAGLFFAWYYLRVTSGVAWPPVGVAPPPIAPALVNTALTLVSGVTMWLANRAIVRDDKRGLLVWISVSAVLGLVFMAVQSVEFSVLSRMATEHMYGSLFIFLLFFHVARVFVGVSLMGVVLIRATLGQLSARRRLLVEGAAMYWYFIVVVWLAVFLVLYLLP